MEDLMQKNSASENDLAVKCPALMNSATVPWYEITMGGLYCKDKIG